RYVRPDGESYALAGLQAYVPNRGDGWAHVLRQLSDGTATQAELRLLGHRTAELHQALTAVTGSDFAPEAITADDVEHWRRRAWAGVEAAALLPYRELLAPWREGLLHGGGGTMQGLKHRIHGDFHLGQVLRTLTDDWVIFDFEGEPARPMAERRRKGSPLQDVAGMLRSFSYAAHTSGQISWEAEARAEFLGGYAGVAGAVCESTLRFFEMEKAVYELAYELAHRPDWVAIPLAGIRALMAKR
ncbi:MAG: phosphotransferase, partial [Terriglobales bacterium]